MGLNGTGYSTNQRVYLIFEAGDSPHIEYGASQGTSNLNDSRTRVRVTGYLVDTAP